MPGTPGPSPAGLASGEPGGARLTGAYTPGTRPGAAAGTTANSAFAMRASTSASIGASGATGRRTESLRTGTRYL